MNEADTCRKLVRPKLEAVGWDTSPHLYNEQVSFTDGRIVVAGSKVRRRKGKIADFLLRFTRDLTLAVVEAKPDEDPAGTGMQQAKDYAEILGLKFAYATNGNEILEFDYFTGQERMLAAYPSPGELWERYKAGMLFSESVAQGLLAPSYPCEKGRRYYHQRAINGALAAILQGKKRVLLTMATGTGKTIIAFKPAFQLGMTATPLREDNRDTYLYFGNPSYTYSLGQGIDDGFLAPYRVHRVVTTVDAVGWRPGAGELDKFGRAIPDDEYQTKDFERVVALKARTQAIARHLTDFLKKTDRFGKTIVFCVDQEHADEIRRALTNLNADLVQQFPDYVCRVVSDEGDIGRGHLSRFQDVETRTPVILTTSQLLTTGVDAPTCKNVVLARVIGSMTEFKQIIGRGTRVRDEYGKLYFNIIDYTGAATRMFADPDFDGEPALATQVEIDEHGQTVEGTEEVVQPEETIEEETGAPIGADDVDFGDEPAGPRKYYADGGQVAIAAHLVYELDADGKKLRVVQYSDYAAEKVRTLYPNAAELRTLWADPDQRAEIIARLEERGIGFDELATAANQPDADPFDLLCHLAFNAPLRTRRERAERLRKDKKDFFDNYSPEARSILEQLLEKYAEHGTAQFLLPDVLEVPPLSEHGNVIEIAQQFGGSEKLVDAVHQLQTLLYAA